jgi:hypothetical protein
MFPKTLREFQSMFATEEACQKYLAECRWPYGFICPRYGNRSSYEIANESAQLDGVCEAGRIEIQIHWWSGTVTEHIVKRPAPGESSLKTPAEAG